MIFVEAEREVEQAKKEDETVKKMRVGEEPVEVSSEIRARDQRRCHGDVDCGLSRRRRRTHSRTASYSLYYAG